MKRPHDQDPAALGGEDHKVVRPLEEGPSRPDPAEPSGEVELPSGPVDLVEKHFATKLFGGYDKFQVHEYLVGLAREWESLLTPARTSTALIEAARSHVAGERPYESLGEDLSRILTAAKEHADLLRSRGEEAHAAALVERDRVLADAAAERDRILQEAAAERDRILQHALVERERLDASNAALRERLTAVVSDVSPLLSSLPSREAAAATAAPAPASDPYPAGPTVTDRSGDTMVLAAPGGGPGPTALDPSAPAQPRPTSPSSRRRERR